MRPDDVPSEVSFHMVSASRDIPVQDAETTEAQTKALEDVDDVDVANVEEDIKIKEQESDLHRKRAQTTEYQTQYFLPAWRQEI